MAQPTNTFATSDAIGQREGLGDIIYDISPAATPALSAMERVSVTSTKH